MRLSDESLLENYEDTKHLSIKIEGIGADGVRGCWAPTLENFIRMVDLVIQKKQLKVGQTVEFRCGCQAVIKTLQGLKSGLFSVFTFDHKRVSPLNPSCLCHIHSNDENHSHMIVRIISEPEELKLEVDSFWKLENGKKAYLGRKDGWFAGIILGESTAAFWESNGKSTGSMRGSEYNIVGRWEE